MEVSRVANPVNITPGRAPDARPRSPARRGSPFPTASMARGRSPSPAHRNVSPSRVLQRYPSRGRTPSPSPVPVPLAPPSPAVITGTFTEYKGSRFGEPIVTYVTRDHLPPPIPTPKPFPDAETTSRSAELARLRAEIARLEAENIRLEEQAQEGVRLHSKYTHSLHDLSNEHAALFDRLARARDDDYLLLLDHYEDAVAQLHRMHRGLAEQEDLQRRLAWVTQQLQATQDETAALKAKLRNVEAHPPVPIEAIDLRQGEQVWVCLSVQAGQLLLQPGIPDSALSSASAAKVAQYAGGPYQQAMRQTHLQSAESKHREESLAHEVVGLKKQVARLRRQLEVRPATPHRLAAPFEEPPPEDWPPPRESPKPRGRSQSRGRTPQPHVNPKAVQKVWVDSLRSADGTAPLYCFSEYGRILRDNERWPAGTEPVARGPHPPPHPAPPANGRDSPWSR
eukprot:EG_transcript_9930